MIYDDMHRIIVLLDLDDFIRSEPYEIKTKGETSVAEATKSWWIARMEYIGGEISWGNTHIETPTGLKSVRIYWLIVTKSRTYHRGYLLFPSVHEPYDREFGGANPLIPIDLAGWQDPLAEALKMADLFAENVDRYSDVWNFRLCFETWRGFGGFSCDFKGDPTTDKVRNALIATTMQFVERYNDDEMRAYIEHLFMLNWR
jgi:hypothetical protein